MDQQKNTEGLAWQISVWDRMVPVYVREIDKRFEPIVEHVVKRADLKSGQHVLDLGTGTGSVALRAAEVVAPNGRVTAVDISPDMLAVARRRAAATNITFVEGRAEAIPADAENIDAVLASLSLMYVLDRGAAAREIARVLRPNGYFAFDDTRDLTSEEFHELTLRVINAATKGNAPVGDALSATAKAMGAMICILSERPATSAEDLVKFSQQAVAEFTQDRPHSIQNDSGLPQGLSDSSA